MVGFVIINIIMQFLFSFLFIIIADRFYLVTHIDDYLS